MAHILPPRSATLLLLLSLLACSALAKLASYKIDENSINVGGISSGGFMAVQMHFAYSSNIKGAAVTAGGPFYCAVGNPVTAMTNCMSTPSLIDLSVSNTVAKQLAMTKDIDPLSNISGSKVYLFSGTNDSVVKQGVMTALKSQYETFGARVTSVFDIPAEHAFITKNYGSKCAYKGSPFINNCSYDMAFESLSVLYGSLQPAVAAVASNVIEFDQSVYTQYFSSMNSKGYLYVPTACQKGGAATCKLFIEFHGCGQTTYDVKLDYVTKLGLNELAESNNIIILYPQAVASIGYPNNPNGCWDWFNYTGGVMDYTGYVTKSSKQMSAVWKMVNDLLGKTPLKGAMASE